MGGDWRALEAFLRLSLLSDYRKADTQVNEQTVLPVQTVSLSVSTD